VTRRSWSKTTVIIRSGQILWKLGVCCRTSLNICTKVYQTPLCPFNENILCLWSRKRNGGAPLPVSLVRSNFTSIPLAIILVKRFIFNISWRISFIFHVLRYARGEFEQDETLPDVSNAGFNGEGCINFCPAWHRPLSRKSFIDAAYTNETSWPKVCSISARFDNP